MVDGDRRALLAGFLGALSVLAVLVAVVGVGDILAALAHTHFPTALGVVVFALCWLLAWSLALRAVLRALDVPTTVFRSAMLYAAAVFANNVTPFGQAGGEPITALFISRSARVRYETGFAAIASVDALNFVPSISLALVGLGVYVTTVAIGDRLQVVAVAVIAFAIAVPLFLALVWRSREEVAARLGVAIATAARPVARVLPWLSLPSASAVARRIDETFGHIERVLADRSRVALVLSLLTLGWLFQMAALGAAFLAIGHPVPVVVLLFAVPVSNIAGAAPLPGGLGSIETALVALLAVTSGAPPAVVTAAVLVYRGAVYWLPMLLGAGSAAALGLSLRS